MPIKCLSDHQIAVLLKYLLRPSNPIANAATLRLRRLLVLLLLDAGLRIGEAVSLQFHCLYLGASLKTSLDVMPAAAKSGIGRSVPLSPALIAAVRDYTEHPNPILGIAPIDYLFPGRNTLQHLSTRHARRHIYRACWEALQLHVTPHMLRHTFATRLMKSTSIRIVQELLGHRSLTSTQIYTHPNSQDLHKAINSVFSE